MSNLLESGIRGLVAAVRGGLEGQRLSLQATSERALQEAEVAWRNRQLDIRAAMAAELGEDE